VLQPKAGQASARLDRVGIRHGTFGSDQILRPIGRTSQGAQSECRGPDILVMMGWAGVRWGMVFVDTDDWAERNTDQGQRDHRPAITPAAGRV